MIDFRPVLFVVGVLLAVLAVVMGLPAAVDAAAGNPDWKVFAASGLTTLFIGGGLALAGRRDRFAIDIRQAFLLTTASWLAIAAFGALPLAFSNLALDAADAFFESMSGITTTGSTVIVGLDRAPPGILLWRALLQWLGGIGIIAMALTILPALRVGGMQLFRTESSDITEKAFPRVAQIAGGIALVYLGLTALCAAALRIAGMSAFEAVAHAMTTLATGGFSTSDASIGHFDSAAIDAVVVVFMLAGGLPFVLYVQAVRGRPGQLLRDSQVRWFLGVVAAAVAAMTLWRWLDGGQAPLAALRAAAFNVVSVITTTGFSTAPYDLWGGFAVTALLLLTVVGGCTGSTAGGIKIFRFQVIHAAARTQVMRLMRPHGVYLAYFNRRPIPVEVASSVMGFFFLFALSFAVLTAGLGLAGLDLLTSISGAATALANVGPGLGPVIGPAGTFAGLPDAAKWMLAFGMLLGRLELYTVLVLFAPAFWRS